MSNKIILENPNGRRFQLVVDKLMINMIIPEHNLYISYGFKENRK